MKSRFAIVNGPRIQQIKSAISKCEQTKTMPIATYFGKLTALWEELNNYEPLITCSCCPNCTAGSTHEKRRENTRLHQFLMGLYTDYYAQTRANVLSSDPLPSLDRAYQLLVQDERVRLAKAVPEEKPPDAVGFAVRSLAPRGRSDSTIDNQEKPDKSHLRCTHCKKSGHKISGCFELIGYPDWWPPNQSKTQTSSTTGTGRGGGKQIHSSGRGRGGGVSPVVAKAHATSSGNAVSLSSIGRNSQTHYQVFSPEQWKALAGFIGNTRVPNDRLTGEFDCNLWIIDTGASRHVTCIDSWLFDIHNVSCPVGLPNGKSVTATKEGSIYFSKNLILKHVLFVPELCCNLISVSQLIDDLQCTVQFTSSTCVIQDQSREMIGTSIRKDGLFYFDGGNYAQQISVNAVSTLELWHKRMGHPSEKVVKLLPPISSCKGSLNKACEVCFRAKHPRDKFNLSDNRASRIFEKVHCDLWGPYRHPSSCDARYFLTIVDDFSRAVWLYLMIDKTEVFNMFMSFYLIVCLTTLMIMAFYFKLLVLGLLNKMVG